jgi:hypothetical protein
VARIEIECRQCGAKCITTSTAEMAEWDRNHTTTCPGLPQAPAPAPATAVEFHPIETSLVGDERHFEFLYSLGLGQSTAEAARDHEIGLLGHDDFLIGEVVDRNTLVNLVDSDLEPLQEWGQFSYRSVAAGLRMTWAPRPGTAAAAAPEEDAAPAEPVTDPPTVA